MFRIFLVIILILLAVPLFNKTKDYVAEKGKKFEAAGQVAKKIFH